MLRCIVEAESQEWGGGSSGGGQAEGGLATSGRAPQWDRLKISVLKGRSTPPLLSPSTRKFTLTQIPPEFLR